MRVDFTPAELVVIHRHAQARTATGELMKDSQYTYGETQEAVDTMGVSGEFAVYKAARAAGHPAKWMGSGLGKPVLWDVQIGPFAIEVKTTTTSHLILNSDVYPDKIDAVVLVTMAKGDAGCDIDGACTAARWMDEMGYWRNPKTGKNRWRVHMRDLEGWDHWLKRTIG